MKKFIIIISIISFTSSLFAQQILFLTILKDIVMETLWLILVTFRDGELMEVA